MVTSKEIETARKNLRKKHLKYLKKNPEKMAEEAYLKKYDKKMPHAEHRPHKEPEEIIPITIKHSECQGCQK